MEEELMKRSSLEAPSFGRSFGAAAELSMDTAEIAGDFWLDDLEFAFNSIKLEPNNAKEIAADKSFNKGRIFPVYPIDGELKSAGEEKLEGGIGHLAMNFEKKSQLSSEEHSGASAAYCVLKSNSTGSVDLESRRLSLRDIVFGRSRSEGDKLLLIPASRERKTEKSCFFRFNSRRKSAAKEAEKKGKKGKENRRVVKELDGVTAHRIYYGKGISGGAHGGSRRTFLPYRRELLAVSFCHSRHNRF